MVWRTAFLRSARAASPLWARRQPSTLPRITRPCFRLRTTCGCRPIGTCRGTDFIARVPTTFDQTVALAGQVGEYAALGRRKGDTWYVGALSNWTARGSRLAFSFLRPDTYEAVIFEGGPHADRDATDYRREVRRVTAYNKLMLHLGSRGGWAARFYPVR